MSHKDQPRKSGRFVNLRTGQPFITQPNPLGDYLRHVRSEVITLETTSIPLPQPTKETKPK